jgi:hypothetical protein
MMLVPKGHGRTLELLAVLFALISFTSLASWGSVELVMDNAPAVHYVNNAGGSGGHRLCRISSETGAWCEQRLTPINAEYLLGGRKMSLQIVYQEGAELERMET